MDDFIEFVLIGFIGLVLCAVFYILGGESAEKFWQKEAVKHGAAAWKVDEEGETTFHWIKN